MIPCYGVLHVQLVIFLDIEDIDCLGNGVSANSTIAALIQYALRLRKDAKATGRDVFVLCTELEP